MVNIDNAKNLLTKEIFDPYGLKIGKIVTYLADPVKNMTSIGIELNNGGFSYHTISNISIENNSVVLNSPWQIEFKQFIEEYASILRKNSALNKLYNSGEIPQEVFNEIKNQYDLKISNLTERRKTLINSLQEKIRTLTSQIYDLKKFLINIKIESMVQTIDEQFYNTSTFLLQNLLNNFSAEKKDVESALNNISENSTSVQIILQNLHPTTSITSQPQPILIRIKESEP